jgi:CRP-like cAMP-binding protein
MSDSYTKSKLTFNASIKNAKEEANLLANSKDDFIQILVPKLVTVLCIPEDIVVKQDEESYDMYFIAKGYCSVNVRDQRKIEHTNIRVLKEGDHFGEISMIYKCRRTATVLSNNYNSMAKLTEDQFKELISEYPDYLKFLKVYLQGYNDKRKKFLMNKMHRVEYFKNISKDARHDLIY